MENGYHEREDVCTNMRTMLILLQIVATSQLETSLMPRRNAHRQRWPQRRGWMRVKSLLG